MAMIALPLAKHMKIGSLGTGSLSDGDKPLVADSEEEDLADCIEVYRSPDAYLQKVARSRRFPAQPPSNKSSILSSAGRWLSRVPSLGGLFSPVCPAITADSTPKTDESERSVRQLRREKRKIPNRGSTSGEESRASSAIGRRRQVPVIDLTVSQPSRKRDRAVEEDQDLPKVHGQEEDELLLSPESAKKRRREEEGAIAAAAVLRGECFIGYWRRNSQLLLIIAVSPVPSMKCRSPGETQGSSGRFEGLS